MVKRLMRRQRRSGAPNFPYLHCRTSSGNPCCVSVWTTGSSPVVTVEITSVPVAERPGARNVRLIIVAKATETRARLIAALKVEVPARAVGIIRLGCESARFALTVQLAKIEVVVAVGIEHFLRERPGGGRRQCNHGTRNKGNDREPHPL